MHRELQEEHGEAMEKVVVQRRSEHDVCRFKKEPKRNRWQDPLLVQEPEENFKFWRTEHIRRTNHTAHQQDVNVYYT